MLTEERRSQIVRIVEERGSVSVSRLMEALDASESTIRRDLNELAAKGMIVKVHGGAIARSGGIVTFDMSVAERATMNLESKQLIARYAAGLIEDDDIVFIDAGTTTGLVIDYLNGSKATFVTNGVSHARKLSSVGCPVYLACGFLKARTEAIVGSDTCDYIRKFHFTKGFFGASGITKKQGLTTPDRNEAAVKESAISHCRDSFVLADSSKFDQICAVTFSDFEGVTIITDGLVKESYKDLENLIVL